MTVILSAVPALYSLVQFTNTFFEENYLVFNKVIELKINPPFEIKKREPQVIETRVVLDYPEEIDTPLEEYICEKFGPYDCKTALAVASAESGLREDALNLNGGDSLDYGIFQINSVHWEREGCHLRDLVDPHKNVDCAYQIWVEQGWTPWVAWKNGSYLTKLGKL